MKRMFKKVQLGEGKKSSQKKGGGRGEENSITKIALKYKGVQSLYIYD